MNGGKFPNLSFAQKQVGGCYYNVRKIIQELKHKSKMSSPDRSKESPSQESKAAGSQISGAQKALSKEVVKPPTLVSSNVLIILLCHMVLEIEKLALVYFLLDHDFLFF